MRAISLHQPWASLIFLPGDHKAHETRSWPYPPKMQGERIAIHAAKRPPRPAEMNPLLESGLLFGWRKFPLGAFVGTTRLAGCWSTEEREPASELDRLGGDWTPGRFAWALADIRPLPEPVPALGRQGWWTIPDDFLSI